MWWLLVNVCGFDADALEQVSLNVMRASFLSAAPKAGPKAEFRAAFGRWRADG